MLQIDQQQTLNGIVPSCRFTRMTWSNGNIFGVTGVLCWVTGEFPTQRPVMRRFDVFFDLRPNKQLSKQWRRWWFETLPRSLLCHCNDFEQARCIIVKHVSCRCMYNFNNHELGFWRLVIDPVIVWSPSKCFIFHFVTPGVPLTQRRQWPGSKLLNMTAHLAAVASWAPSQYKDRLIYVWRFPC